MSAREKIKPQLLRLVVVEVGAILPKITRAALVRYPDAPPIVANGLTGATHPFPRVPPYPSELQAHTSHVDTKYRRTLRHGNLNEARTLPSIIMRHIGISSISYSQYMIRNLQYKKDLLAIGTFGLLVSILHHSALAGSWRWDDGMHLLHTTQYSWSSLFTDPEVLRSVSGNQFTPWNLLLYYINVFFFGANASLYYAHHLISLFAAAVGVYVLLRQWLPAEHAWVAPALLLTGVPTFQMAQQLMVGHYIYGLIFVTTGMVLLIQALKRSETSRQTSFSLAVASAFFYGLSCLCKEVYVPFLIFWVVIPWTIKSRCQKALAYCTPAFVTGLVYTVARIQLFRDTEGYYGGGIRSWDIANIIYSLINIPSTLFGDGIRGVLSSMLIAIAIFAGFGRSAVSCIVGAAALLAISVPLIFLASNNPSWDLHARYLWAPWIVICVTWSAPWTIFQSIQKPATALFVILVFLQILSVRPVDLEVEAMFDSHSRTVLSAKVKYWAPAEFNGSGYMLFVTYSAHEALRRNGFIKGDPPKVMRFAPYGPTQEATTQVWSTPCQCFRPFLALTSGEQEAALTKMRAEKGMLLPGSHPLADMYQGPSPKMWIEGNRLHVFGTTASQGPGHVMLLSGWAPSKLVASKVFTQPPDAAGNIVMSYNFILVGSSVDAVQRTRQQLCILMQSQVLPYTFIALDSAAPTSACRKLLTPWGLRGKAAAPSEMKQRSM